MMNNRMRMFVGLMGLSLLLSGCEKKKVPEHVIQQQAREARKVARKKQLAQQVKKTREEDMWPAGVKEAYFRLFLASDLQVTTHAQALAQQGQQAVPALKFFLGKSTMKSKRKRALVSFMLVDLHMFRPVELAALAREWKLPLVQRAAIEGLVRIGSDRSTELLEQIKKEAVGGGLDRHEPAGAEPKGHGHGHGHEAGEKVELGPLSAFMDQVHTRDKWGFSDEQLKQLDQLLQARIGSEVAGVLKVIRDRSLDKGLLQMLRSPVVLPPTQLAVADKLVELNSKRVRQLCGPENPMMLRVHAAKKMIMGGSRADLAFLKKLARRSKDPFSPVLSRLLTEK